MADLSIDLNAAERVVRTHTDGTLTRLPLCDASGEAEGWLIASERLDRPVIFTDAGLLDYAQKLTQIFA